MSNALVHDAGFAGPRSARSLPRMSCWIEASSCPRYANPDPDPDPDCWIAGSSCPRGAPPQPKDPSPNPNPNPGAPPDGPRRNGAAAYRLLRFPRRGRRARPGDRHARPRASVTIEPGRYIPMRVQRCIMQTWATKYDFRAHTLSLRLRIATYYSVISVCVLLYIT